MHPPEVSGGLVLLGISDRAQRTMGLDRHLADRRTCKCERRRADYSPVWHAKVAHQCGVFDNQARALQAHQTIGELVLDRLKLADELAELAADFGVLNGQI